MLKKLLPLAVAALVVITMLLLWAPDANPKKIYQVNDGSADTTVPPGPAAKDHKGKNVVATNGVITLSTGLDNDYYLLDSINRTGYLYLETRLDRFINEKAHRIPLNLSIVVDHSGSMQGEKMEYAKKAAKEIINRLSPDDYVSVVIYDDNIEVIQASVQVLDKAMIIHKIDKILSDGSTNLWGGTEKGFEEVRSNYKKNYVNRVLLISDGLANVGITSNYEIRKRVQHYKDKDGITLSSFGVGLDYNELLMTDMAEAGSGNYYFIDSPDKMTALFDKELNGLLNVAAQNAELKIKMPVGVKLRKVFAAKYEESGDEVSIQYRDLFSEETKGVLVNFAIDNGENEPLKFVSSLAYDDVNDGQRKSLTTENILKPTQELETWLTYYNKSVLQQTILFTANENMEKAMLEADKGDYQRARGLIQANGKYLESNKEYVKDLPELKKMDTTNLKYFDELQNAETMSADSVKFMQKSNREKSYKARNKKQ
jgi:Ca-activated chloride channel family protein